MGGGCVWLLLLLLWLFDTIYCLEARTHNDKDSTRTRRPRSAVDHLDVLTLTHRQVRRRPLGRRGALERVAFVPHDRDDHHDDDDQHQTAGTRPDADNDDLHTQMGGWEAISQSAG